MLSIEPREVRYVPGPHLPRVDPRWRGSQPCPDALLSGGHMGRAATGGSVLIATTPGNVTELARREGPTGHLERGSQESIEGANRPCSLG